MWTAKTDARHMISERRVTVLDPSPRRTRVSNSDSENGIALVAQVNGTQRDVGSHTQVRCTRALEHTCTIDACASSPSRTNQPHTHVRAYKCALDACRKHSSATQHSSQASNDWHQSLHMHTCAPAHSERAFQAGAHTHVRLRVPTKSTRVDSSGFESSRGVHGKAATRRKQPSQAKHLGDHE